MLSLVHVGHNYWHPIIATSFSQDNSSEFSPIMPEEFGEHLIRDQRAFLHTESVQILQIHSSMLVLLLFSSPHSLSVGFRSKDREKINFELSDPFLCLFWIVVLVEDPNMAHYKISNRGSQVLVFYLLVFALSLYSFASIGMRETVRDVETGEKPLGNSEYWPIVCTVVAPTVSRV